ncbi:MAG: hypothetical protein WA716_15365, partial [Pseudolabrys sp.]
GRKSSAIWRRSASLRSGRLWRQGPDFIGTNESLMLADYTAACLEPKAMQRFAPASRSGEKPDLCAWRRPIVVGTRKGVETMCGEPAADLAR